MTTLTRAELARTIDHTILRADATRADVAKVCREAREHGFYSVCVNPVHVPDVAAALAGSDVATCAVVDFPLGATPSAVKAAEARWVVAAGAREVDMVINVGALKEGRRDEVEADIAAVREACGPALLKVIIETCLLSDAEKEAACRLAVAAGAQFVKTSTVALMRRVVGPDIGVKASGGIRTREDALRMLAAGASRIGASASVAIVTG